MGRQAGDVGRRRSGPARRSAARSRRPSAASSSCRSRDGPSRVKNSPLRDVEVQLAHRDEVAEALRSRRSRRTLRVRRRQGLASLVRIAATAHSSAPRRRSGQLAACDRRKCRECPKIVRLPLIHDRTRLRSYVEPNPGCAFGLWAATVVRNVDAAGPLVQQLRRREMASTASRATADRGGQRPAGAREAPPVDALHAHGLVRRASTTSRSSSAARAPTSGTSTATATSTASPALFCVNAGHGRAEIGDAMAAQVRELDFITNWSYAHPRAIELADADRGPRPGRPEPGLLHLGRLGGGRVGDQAGSRLPPAHRQPAQDQVHRPRGRLPRDHDRARCRRPGSPALRTPLRAPRSRRVSRRRTPTATTGPRTATRSGPPTRSRRDRVRGPGDRRAP